MKKKLIIPIIIFLLLIIVGVVCYFVFKDNTKAIITLDINPSIELKIDTDDKITSIKALNDDGKDIVDDSLIGKTLDDALTTITDNIVDKDYMGDDGATIIMHTEGKIDNKKVEDIIHQKFDGRKIHVEVITIEKITKEDEELAKKYNISPAKASYINTIAKENKEIPVEDIINKPVDELKETKETGKYCDKGYTLRGDFCEKESNRYEASTGNVCPDWYVEYKGKCYQEVPFEETDKLVCNNGFNLEGEECVREETINAEAQYHCDKGELMRKGDVYVIGSKDNDKMYCVDKSTGKKPTLRCLLNSGHIMINGKCYNGPAPTINGGCPNGDTLRGGWCYSLDNEDQWQCPNGFIYEKSKGTYVELCPDTFTYIEPTITGYKCPDGYTLNDKKCIKRETEKAQKERVCPDGYKMIEFDRCINDKTADKVSGYYCTGEGRLENNVCVVYESIPAKQK